MTKPNRDEVKGSASGAPQVPLGLRERKKAEKERLIREAARDLFLQNGYEATTLREIARKADVGFGTVFSYAQDKPGLLAMIFVEELKALPPLFPNRGGEGDILDELVEGLGNLYAFWARIPSLSSLVLQQMEFYGSNPHMEQIVARRQAARRELADWLGRLSGAGRIDPDIDTELAAETLFAVYTSAVREWSATAPADVESGRKRLKKLMHLPVRALLTSG